MRTAKRILAEFMTVVMVLQACSPTVAAVAAGWQNISSEIATAAAEASDAAESGETKSDVTTGSGSSDTGAESDSAGDDAAKDDAAAGDTTDNATGSDSTGDQTEGDDAADDAAADDAEQDADDATSEDAEDQAGATITNLDELVAIQGGFQLVNHGIALCQQRGRRDFDFRRSRGADRAVLCNRAVRVLALRAPVLGREGQHGAVIRRRVLQQAEQVYHLFAAHRFGKQLQIQFIHKSTP